MSGHKGEQKFACSISRDFGGLGHKAGPCIISHIAWSPTHFLSSLAYMPMSGTAEPYHNFVVSNLRDYQIVFLN